MMKLRWDPIAKKQITGIFNTYRQRYGEKTAKKITDAIRQTAKRLKDQPNLGFKEPMLADNPAGYRSLIEGHYKLVYCIEKDNYIRIATTGCANKMPYLLVVTMEYLSLLQQTGKNNCCNQN